MANILTGSSRAVLRHMIADAPALIRVTIIPMLIVASIMGFGMFMMLRSMRALAALDLDGTLSPAMLNEIMLMQGIGFGVQLAMGGALSYVFVALVRHYLAGRQSDAKRLNGPGMSAFMVFIYGIGVSLLTMVAMIVPMIAATIASSIAIAAASYAGPDPLSAGLAALVVGGAFIAAFLFALWFMARFLVGFPDVALGATPDFFSGLWPLSRGATFALPWRLFLSYLGMVLILLPVQAFMLWRALPGSEGLQGDAGPEQIFELQERVLGGLLWAMPFYLIVSYFYLVFLSLLLAEAYRRFKDRRGG